MKHRNTYSAIGIILICGESIIFFVFLRYLIPITNRPTYKLSNSIDTINIRTEKNSYSLNKVKKNILKGKFYFAEQDGRYGKCLFIYYGNKFRWDLLGLYSDSDYKYISTIDIPNNNLKYNMDKQTIDYINSFVHAWCDKMNNIKEVMK